MIQKKDFLSVILLNYNMKGLIKGALDSLKRQDYDKNKFEVIVFDNDSSDGADIWIEQNYPWVRLIRTGKNTGYAAMNLGLKYAKGDYLFFLNNDLTFAPDCLSKLMHAIKTLPEDVAAVTPLRKDIKTKKTAYHRKILSRSFYGCSTIDKHPKKYYEDGFTGFPLYKREILNKLGTFIDPDYFMYAEDIDFCYRTRMIGYRNILVTDAVIYNMGRETSKKYMGEVRITYFNERNLLQTFFKDVEKKNIFVYFPYMFFMRILALILALVRFRFSIFWAKLRAYCWVATNIFKILKKRKNVQKRRICSDSEIFSVIGNEYIFLKKLLNF